MKKIPLTIIPIITIIIFVSLFLFVVPKEGDLISAGGDFFLGLTISLLFFLCLFLDIVRYKKYKIIRNHPTHDLNSNSDPLWIRIRKLITEKGIDTNTSHVIDFFTDDTCLYFGLLVTQNKRVIQFDYDYLRKDEGEGDLKTWNDITDTWKATPWKRTIEHALNRINL